MTRMMPGPGLSALAAGVMVMPVQVIRIIPVMPGCHEPDDASLSTGTSSHQIMI